MPLTDELVELVCKKIEEAAAFERDCVASAARELGMRVPGSTWRNWKKDGADLCELPADGLTAHQRRCVKLLERVEEAEAIAAYAHTQAIRSANLYDKRNAGTMIKWGQIRFKHFNETGVDAPTTIVIMRDAPAKDRVPDGG